MTTTLAGQYGPEGFEFADGRPARNTDVTVLTTSGAFAILYTDKTKTAFADNPTQTDEYGNLSFYAEPGEYGIVVNGRPMAVMVPVHPEDPALGVGEGGTTEHPVVDWYSGDGPPTVVLGAGPGDMYIDSVTGQLYQLR